MVVLYIPQFHWYTRIYMMYNSFPEDFSISFKVCFWPFCLQRNTWKCLLFLLFLSDFQIILKFDLYKQNAFCKNISMLSNMLNLPECFGLLKCQYWGEGGYSEIICPWQSVMTLSDTTQDITICSTWDMKALGWIHSPYNARTRPLEKQQEEL